LSVGNGFDALAFQIFINGGLFLNQSFSDLASANAFFTNDTINLGSCYMSTPFAEDVELSMRLL
jgi:hypothetical protein